MNGAPANTFDLDIVVARNPDNVARLEKVLNSMDAVYRRQPSRRIKPNASHLSSAGHHNPITKFGPLDVLGSIGKGLEYEDLVPNANEMTAGEHLCILVLDLARIIALKEELGGEKDLAVLPILWRTLREKSR